MFKVALKWIVSILSLCAVIILAAILVLRFQPQLYLSLVNKFSPYDVYAKVIKVEPFTFSMALEGLTIKEKKTQKQPLALTHLLLNISWRKLIFQHNNSWYLELENGKAVLPEPSETTSGANKTIGEPVNIHHWLSILNINARDIELVFNDNKTLQIKQLNTNLDNDNHRDSRDVKQEIQLSLLYKEFEKQLSVTGLIGSASIQGTHHLTLFVEKINLTSLLAPDEKPEDVETVDIIIADQKGLDWSWLEGFQKTLIDISIDELVVDEIRFDDLSLKALIDDSVYIQNLSSELVLSMNDTVLPKQVIEMTGHLSGLKDGNIETQFQVNLPVSGLKTGTVKTKNDQRNSLVIQGVVNPLEPLKSDFAFEANVSNLSQVISHAQEAVFEQYEQFLPTLINGRYQLKNNRYQLSSLDIKAGKSDLKGQLSAMIDDGVVLLDAALQADYIVYETLAVDVSAETDSVPEKAIETEVNTQAVFSTQTIDWSWLENHQIDASVFLKQVRIDEHLFENVDLPVILKAEKFSIEPLSVSLSDSALIGGININKQQESAVLGVHLKGQDILLSALNLVDPAQLEGGVVTTDISLQSAGGSLHDMASTLNGKVLISAKDAVIANGAFELIGSDLISELLSKLNPFAKSNPTTELKCAVFNLPVQDGVIMIDNGIAVQTSKVTIVANGDINLKEETLKLNLKPTSTAGVGVNAGSLVKFITLGGKLNAPKPIVSTSGLLKTGVAVGAALSTGGATVIADGFLSKTMAQNACENAFKPN